MKKIIKVGLILNYILWGGVFIYSLSLYTAYNGFFNFFDFKCGFAQDFQIELKEGNNSYIVFYSYVDDGNFYKSKEGISKTLYDEKIGDTKKLEICYNSSFPNLSHLKQANLSLRRNKIGIIISLIIIIFFVSIDLFANKDYWGGKYERFFKKV